MLPKTILQEPGPADSPWAGLDSSWLQPTREFVATGHDNGWTELQERGRRLFRRS